VVTAIGSPRQLSLLSVFGWSGVGVSVVLSAIMSTRGLTAVIYALGAGWLTVSLGAAALAYAALRTERA
jgi:hypothetical protein